MSFSLKKYNTFGIDSKCDELIELDSAAKLHELAESHALADKKFTIIGGGSNVVFGDYYHGTVLHVGLKHHIVPHYSGDCDIVQVSMAAGYQMNEAVEYMLDHDLYGLENLAAIPGTVGAAAVQNIGAYGVEAKDVIAAVEVVDVTTGRNMVVTREECAFGYRDSVFKHDLKERYLIESVVFEVTRRYVPKIEYKALREALRRKGYEKPTARQVSKTVAELRWSKLPKPEELGSAGSFFKNPVVTSSLYESLKEQYPTMPAYEAGDKFKLSAGWLIEQCGWKGKSLGRCGVYDKQALVLVNRGGCTFDDVRHLADAIAADVEAKFAVTLEREAIYVE